MTGIMHYMTKNSPTNSPTQQTKHFSSLLLVFTLVLTGFLTGVQSSQAEDFLLFYGNDVRGELQPCG